MTRRVGNPGSDIPSIARRFEKESRTRRIVVIPVLEAKERLLAKLREDGKIA